MSRESVSNVDVPVFEEKYSRMGHKETGSHMLPVSAGGQAKRCNIGIALLSDPRIIFLDEPTSGLDSYTSHEVCPVHHSPCLHNPTLSMGMPRNYQNVWHRHLTHSATGLLGSFSS